MPTARFQRLREEPWRLQPEIVLIHGAWVTAASWDEFRNPFEQVGHLVHTPTWPLLKG